VLGIGQPDEGEVDIPRSSQARAAPRALPPVPGESRASMIATRLAMCDMPAAERARLERELATLRARPPP
jgi:hypothetical protein